MSATLPLSRVMRVRRHQPTRLEGFVDASFAFAVTLVVISIGHVPRSVDEMLTALRGLPAFAACFLMLARIWLSHRDWSRYYDIEDAASVTFSLLLVFVVLFYVFPLRLLFVQMFYGLSGGRLHDGVTVEIRTVDELRAAYIVFGLGLAAIAAVFLLLYRHAVYCAAAVGLSADEIIFTRLKIHLWTAQLLLALLSIALAQWMPMTNTLSLSVPGLVYAINFPFSRVMRARTRRSLTAATRASA